MLRQADGGVSPALEWIGPRCHVSAARRWSLAMLYLRVCSRSIVRRTNRSEPIHRDQKKVKVADGSSAPGSHEST
jgi:hypothetical protein